MKGLSPTQRTLRELRQRGVIAGIVEKWNQFAGPAGIRQDLWGFLDVLCLYPDRTGVTGVQCCARSGHAEHRKKILENDIAPEFLRVGNVIEIWSWGKQKLRRGGKAERWMPKIEILVLKDFEK